MLDKILGLLRDNGPLPMDLLLTCLEREGVKATADQVITLGDDDKLVLIEFERPDDGVFLIVGHPKARFRCRNFR